MRAKVVGTSWTAADASYRLLASSRDSHLGTALEMRPGLIEIELTNGTRLRVDAFVNERALQRVVSVLKAVT